VAAGNGGVNPDWTPDQLLAQQPVYQKMMAEARAMDLLNADYDRRATVREQETGRVELHVPFLVFMVESPIPATHRRN
jgi:hypothetical protein